MADLVFNVPDEKTPGYLRRLMAATRFSEQIKAGKIDIQLYDDLVDFLLGFISEPEDRVEAREVLLDASQEQYMQLLEAIKGESGNPTSPEQSETS